ncbi:hypothetical protein [Actinoplanes nipponensis]|uniref:hypothetical protein n=1 Tax=Actinoplanes nipponensis TaxID=135950 RepID=UPI0031EEE58D
MRPEVGSEFHWDPAAVGSSPSLLPARFELFATGCGALSTLLRRLAPAGRLHVPSFFCMGVAEALSAYVPIAGCGWVVVFCLYMGGRSLCWCCVGVGGFWVVYVCCLVCFCLCFGLGLFMFWWLYLVWVLGCVVCGVFVGWFCFGFVCCLWSWGGYGVGVGVFVWFLWVVAW